MAPRHRLYSPELAETTLERLTDGESLRSICADEGMPSRGAVEHWNVSDYEGFASRYARARETGVQHLADELLEIADSATNDDNPSRVRNRIDARKWILARMLPKQYGDRVDLNHSGELALKDVPDEQLEARITELLRKAGMGGSVGGSGETEGEA